MLNKRNRVIEHLAFTETEALRGSLLRVHITALYAMDREIGRFKL